MKKLLLLSACLLCAYLAPAQVFVNDVNINELDITYCQIVGTEVPLSNKVSIAIDYGQERKMLKNQAIKGKDGKAMQFDSMIDTLNFMQKNGWDFVSTYTATLGSSEVYYFLLKRADN